MSITMPITKLKIKVAGVLSVKAEPTAPMTPPRMKNDTKRPIWKSICGLTLSPSFANVADIERTSPPTTAMHVESEAIIPMKNTVPYVTLLAETKLTTPSFCKSTNNRAKPKATGTAILKSDHFFSGVCSADEQQLSQCIFF